MAEEVTTHDYHETHRLRTLGGFKNLTCIGCRACTCHFEDVLKAECKRQAMTDEVWDENIAKQETEILGPIAEVVSGEQVGRAMGPGSDKPMRPAQEITKVGENLRGLFDRSGQVEPKKAVYPQSQSGPTPDDDPDTWPRTELNRPDTKFLFIQPPGQEPKAAVVISESMFVKAAEDALKWGMDAHSYILACIERGLGDDSEPFGSGSGG